MLCLPDRGRMVSREDLSIVIRADLWLSKSLGEKACMGFSL